MTIKLEINGLLVNITCLLWLVGSSVTSIVKTVPFLDFRIGRMGIGLNKAMFEFAQERAKKGQKAR